MLNARLQTGFTNPMDGAILAAGGADVGDAQRIDELPYDFSRKRLSVLVREGGSERLVTKGAFDSVISICGQAALPDGTVVPFAQVQPQVVALHKDLGAKGYRVLAVATRDMGSAAGLTPSDESDLTYCGLLTFLDPPKPGADTAVRGLTAAGISVRMITGDDRLVAAEVGRQVGLDGSALITGQELEALDDATLAQRAAITAIFAEVDPIAKERILRGLRTSGRVVGYLGDGINDAPALHAADVGISVDSAVDVAKEAAAIVLLDKDLGVLLHGVQQGRRTFANTMKYVSTTTSANFGNMLSMAIAAVVLPFLPLLPAQILLINFLTDIPSLTIATDDVDPEQLERPHSWDIGFVRNFMILFGGVSTVFDLLTFAVLRIGFVADATLFRSGWFLESVATELAVLFVLRTRRPFFRSRPSRLLAASSLILAAVTLAIPYSPLAGPLQLEGPPLPLLAALVVITGIYVLATESTKQVFYRRGSAAARA